MDVFVLTALMEDKKTERPVAVTTKQEVATQWANENKNNDWILFELDDLSLTDLAEGSKTTFRPKPAPTTSQTQQQLDEMTRQIEEANRQIEEQMAKRPPHKKSYLLVRK